MRPQEIVTGWQDAKRKAELRFRGHSEDELRELATQYRGAIALNSGLWRLLSQNGRTSTSNNRRYGLDVADHGKRTVIDLGEASLEGHAGPLSIRARLTETHQSGGDSSGGIDRVLRFEAKEADEEFYRTVSNGTFRLEGIRETSYYGFIVPESLYKKYSQGLPEILEFNKHLKDIAEILGLDASEIDFEADSHHLT